MGQKGIIAGVVVLVLAALALVAALATKTGNPNIASQIKVLSVRLEPFHLQNGKETRAVKMDWINNGPKVIREVYGTVNYYDSNNRRLDSSMGEQDECIFINEPTENTHPIQPGEKYHDRLGIDTYVGFDGFPTRVEVKITRAYETPLPLP